MFSIVQGTLPCMLTFYETAETGCFLLFYILSLTLSSFFQYADEAGLDLTVLTCLLPQPSYPVLCFQSAQFSSLNLVHSQVLGQGTEISLCWTEKWT